MDVDIDFELPSVICAIGKPRRGKSYLTKHLIYYFSTEYKDKDKRFEFIRVFTRSKYNNDYDFIPDAYVSNYDPDVFQNYIQSLEDIIVDEGNIPSNCIVFDDIVGLLDANS